MTLKSPCLTEEHLLDLFYGEMPESEMGKAQEHIAACSGCAAAWKKFRAFAGGLELPVVDGGKRATDEAIRFLGLDGEPESPKTPVAAEILTIEEVADFLRVRTEQVRSMLHVMPHFVFAGEIRLRRSSLEKFLEELEDREKRNSKALSGSLAPLPFSHGKF
jgi:hypothetical protein